MTRDELAAFDDAVVDTVAADHDLSVERLTDLVRTHQSNVRALPGVEDIVYEWRNYFHQDPLVGRTEAVYYLALPEHVWDEFVEDMGIDETERAALLAVHDRQARAADTDAGVEVARLDADAALVLSRP
ncbi:hypothetical protein [Halosimplex salinum]|uniref:hypothetical protein n=1 Tax=Halosimplex salinum TaxID=1710538 RepID=UPI000F45F33F|nr:hypothetical protein [Halosimplex salinum]